MLAHRGHTGFLAGLCPHLGSYMERLLTQFIIAVFELEDELQQGGGTGGGCRAGFCLTPPVNPHSCSCVSVSWAGRAQQGPEQSRTPGTCAGDSGPTPAYMGQRCLHFPVLMAAEGWQDPSFPRPAPCHTALHHSQHSPARLGPLICSPSTSGDGRVGASPLSTSQSAWGGMKHGRDWPA